MRGSGAGRESSLEGLGAGRMSMFISFLSALRWLTPRPLQKPRSGAPPSGGDLVRMNAICGPASLETQRSMALSPLYYDRC